MPLPRPTRKRMILRRNRRTKVEPGWKHGAPRVAEVDLRFLPRFPLHADRRGGGGRGQVMDKAVE